jgi:hypothetical protein
MKRRDPNPDPDKADFSVDRKLTKTVKHFGGRHNTFHFDDGTAVNVYNNFRAGDDPNPDGTKKVGLISAKDKVKKKLQSKNTTVNTNTETATVDKKAVKAPKAKAVPAEPTNELSRKDRAAKADAVIADLVNNPLPAEFEESELHTRVGFWTSTVYKWVRANATSKKVGSKNVYTLNA